MQGLIALTLLIFIIQNFIHIYANFQFLKLNRERFIHSENVKRLLEEIDILKKELQKNEEIVLKITDRELYNVGFALTPKGVKVLPKDWHEKVWNKP